MQNTGDPHINTKFCVMHFPVTYNYKNKALQDVLPVPWC